MNRPTAPVGLDLVRARAVMLDSVEAWFTLQPGDRPVLSEGEPVVRGSALAERLREARTEVDGGPGSSDGQPGAWWSGTRARGRGAKHSVEGELLFRSGGQWRIATGEPSEPLEGPFDGVVSEVRPGAGIRVRTASRGLAGD